MAENLNFWDSKEQSERARKPRQKGGFQIKKNRKCNSNCQLWGKCLYCEKSRTDFKGKCALANTNGSPIAKSRFVSVLIGGWSEYETLLKSLFWELEESAEKEIERRRQTGKSEFAVKRMLFQDAIRLYRELYGNRDGVTEAKKEFNPANIVVVKPANPEEKRLTAQEIIAQVEAMQDRKNEDAPDPEEIERQIREFDEKYGTG